MKHKIWLIPAGLFLLVAAAYLTFAFSGIPFVANLRQTYVETAMGTLRHQWLATALLPETVVEQAMARQNLARAEQMEVRSVWETDTAALPASVTDEESFFALFHELNPLSVKQWLTHHPEALNKGWSQLKILPENSEELLTLNGEPVLAVDAPNQILLVEVQTARARGVLAVAKDPSLLSIRPSASIGISGQTVGQIAELHGGVLAITCGAFHDANESGNGGDLAGYAMCGGAAYGDAHLPAGNKRVELREDDLIYITDSTDPVNPKCTDAAEFRPALIVDGQVLVEQGWAGLQPRVCLGQSDRREILMLVMEGRILSEGILGASVLECARILRQHGCMQAINLDGGNSAMLWYDGSYMTRCCDPEHPEGRPVPTAVVYGAEN